MNPNVPKNFNPWPVGIIAFFACFIAATAGLIAFVSSGRMELVAPDYYEQEVRYQNQVDRLTRTKGVAQQIRVAHDPARQCITIALPVEHAQGRAEGTIELYRPSAAGLDRHLKLEVDFQGVQTLDAKDLQPGLWKVRIQWMVGSQEYYAEQSVVVAARAL